MPRQPSLGEIARVFLKLGIISFGGPAAHIAMMDRELVQRRQWLTSAQFLDLVSASNLIPGPNSTEVAIHIGRLRRGAPGLVVAGVCFILPAAITVLALAALYVRYGSLPQMASVLYGVKPVVIAIIAIALWRLARAAVKSWTLALIAAAAIAASAIGTNEIALLLIAGVLAMVFHRLSGGDPPYSRDSRAGMRAAPLLVPGGGIAAAAASAKIGLWPLFAYFAKVGSVLFGSGYVLLAFLRSELVEQRGWLTENQLLDAVAIGQATPGPVFTTATFVGYLLGGSAGAAAATIGIFVPAFVFVAASAPLLPRLRRSPLTGAALDGINAASLALMAVVSVHLARSALIDTPTVVAAGVSLLLLLDGRINSAWLIGAGALLGLALR